MLLLLNAIIFYLAYTLISLVSKYKYSSLSISWEIDGSIHQQPTGVAWEWVNIYILTITNTNL